jgi:CRISPR/Cas system-associated exonuclease Cas4 (RecB family)
MGAQQEAGQKTHSTYTQLEHRRNSLLKSSLPITIKSKQFDVGLVSKNLQVKGRLDMLIITKENEYIPIEFKDMASFRGSIHQDHKYQLVILALLVEDAYHTIVRRGIMHYLPEEQTILFPITQGLKARAKKYVDRILRMFETGCVPDMRRECNAGRIGCGFADQCIDY